MQTKNKKTVLLYIGHPAHYHNISNLANRLDRKGYFVLLVVRPKDVVLDLIKNVTFEKVLLPESDKKSISKFGLIISVLRRQFLMLKIVLKYRPFIMFGTDIVITHIGTLLNIPSFILNEDDAKEVPFLADMGMRFSTGTFSPISCNIEKYQSKKISYPGYHELAYLGPNYFKSDKTKIQHLFKEDKPYFIIRFAELLAHHDEGKKGINDKLAKEIIDILKSKGNVYITSERKLPPDFEPFRIKIPPSDIHHALYYANMYIGDSQTMAAEAAVLGTPSIRYNDFVGKLGYLEDLEHNWNLTRGIETDKPEKLLSVIKELSENLDVKSLWLERKNAMLKNSADFTEMLYWFITDYPNSMLEVKKNPNFYTAFLYK